MIIYNGLGWKNLLGVTTRCRIIIELLQINKIRFQNGYIYIYNIIINIAWFYNKGIGMNKFKYKFN